MLFYEADVSVRIANGADGAFKTSVGAHVLGAIVATFEKNG
jgi:hypothetical protein